MTTHVNNHTLDLIITRCDDCNTNYSIVLWILAFPIISSFALLDDVRSKKPYPRKETTYRKLESISYEKLRNDIIYSPLVHDYDSFTGIVENYETTLSDMLHSHAPTKNRVVTLHLASQWFNDDIIALK